MPRVSIAAEKVAVLRDAAAITKLAARLGDEAHEVLSGLADKLESGEPYASTMEHARRVLFARVAARGTPPRKHRLCFYTHDDRDRPLDSWVTRADPFVFARRMLKLDLLATDPDGFSRVEISECVEGGALRFVKTVRLSGTEKKKWVERGAIARGAILKSA